VHAHHPFLLGDTALRIASAERVPLVFTHHTLFEQYTHYLPVNHGAAERFMLTLATGYANLCTQVFAPSESVVKLLRARGVRRPIAVVPTGIPVGVFRRGNRVRGRRELRLPPEAFVVGHVGRLREEKNIGFLTRAVVAFLQRSPEAHALIVGDGPSVPAMQAIARRADVGGRVRWAGVREGRGLLDAYRAMDVFAFASHSETQGLVLVEAMAAGVPVVAVDASGVREVVRDRVNGRLLAGEHAGEFAAALQWVAGLTPQERARLQAALRNTADAFSMERCAQRALSIYGRLRVPAAVRFRDEGAWTRASRRIATERKLLARTARAATAAAIR
jgi:glycosyltransferase involved in cell wall biosynthesis